MRYTKLLPLFIIITTIFMVSAPANTAAQGWKFIGDKTASFGIDRDVLQVRGNDAYQKIKLRVTDAPLHIIDIDVYFENGEKLNVPIKNKFRQGEESRVIDFPGGERKLKKIEFLYETIGVRKGRARIAVWGMR